MRTNGARSILPQWLYPPLHLGLSHVFPNCLWAMDTHEVALSFDDGPHPDFTPQLLDQLDQVQIKATFFVLGERAHRWPDLIKAIAARGHHIGIHGYQHHAFPTLSQHDLYRSLTQTQQVIAKASGRDPQLIRHVRPPNGFFLPQTLNLMRSWNFLPVMWTVVPEDWVQPSIECVVQRVLHQIQPGAIVVLHDGVWGGSQVAETVRLLIPLLQSQGYQFRLI